MFSKIRKLSTVVLATLLAVSVASCRFQISDDELSTESSIGALGGGQLGCLNGLGKTLQSYFEGATSSREIERKWECADGALKLFVERVKGKNLEYYTPDELRRFLQRYFVTDLTISDRLLSEVFEVKNSIFGGGINKISHAEVNKVRDLLAAVKAATTALHPYMPLSPKSFERASDERLQAATQSLILATQRIGGALDLATVSYPFERFDALLAQLELVYPGPGPRNLRENMGLLVTLKRVLISPRMVLTRGGRETDGLSGHELVRLLDYGARVQAFLLRLSQLRATEGSLFVGHGRLRLQRLANDVLDLLHESLTQYPERVIPFGELQSLAAALPAELLGPVQRETLGPLVVPVVCKLIQGNGGCDPKRGTFGLDAYGIERLRGVLAQWSAAQAALEATYERLFTERTDEPSPGDVLDRAYLPEDLLHYLNEFQLIPDLTHMVTSFRPLFTRPSAQIHFQPHGGDRRHSLRNLSQMIWIREAMKLIIEGYAKDPDRARTKKGLNLSEMEDLIRDVNPILIDFKIVDPAQHDLHKKRFREASLFTYASDGNDYLDVDEGTNYFALILSGSKLAQRIYKGLTDSEAKCQTREADAYGRFWLREGCVKEHFLKRIYRFTDHMPDMAEYFRKLSNSQKGKFWESLVASARQDNGSRPVMNSYISEGTASTLQYVEVLFSRFDKDRNGKIESANDEVEEAYQTFRCTLVGFSGQVNSRGEAKDSIVRAIFAYMLSTGKAPDTDQECGGATGQGIAQVVQWLPPRNVSADRTRVLEIFAEISKLTARKKPAGCPQIPAYSCP